MKRLDRALEFGVDTDPGMVRGNNEDAVHVEPRNGIAILADGMGGANAGEVASGMATTLLGKDIREALAKIAPGDAARNREPRAFALLRDTIAVANSSIFHAAEHQPQYAGMGTTVVVALFYDNRVAVAHVGDSRLYRVRAGRLTQLTRDHSFLQMQLDAGLITHEQARTSKQKNIVTRALGMEAEVETEVHEHAVERGDVYVLCSDGLHDMVDDDVIALTVGRAGADLQAAAEALVKLANDNGGRDNVSVILVRARGDFRARRSWLRRLLSAIRP